MSTAAPETSASRVSASGINPAHQWFAPLWLLRRLGLLAPVTLATGLVYKGMLESWHRTWGATPSELARSLPGDELQPDAGYVATRAVTINAPPQAIWPWIVQMGQGARRAVQLRLA
jgi:hypothetical protein